MRRPRNLSREERALWDHVTRRDTPLADRPVSGVPTAASPTPASRQAPSPSPAFRVGQSVDHRRDDDLLPGLGERMRGAPLAMDAKAHARMTRGKLRPDARIDLHGMIVSDAHATLMDFVRREYGAGSRLLLVITGKGRISDDLAPMPVRQGVLRHQVPQWLALPPLRALVLQVRPAHLRHGGDGAYYVYLRRPR